MEARVLAGPTDTQTSAQPPFAREPLPAVCRAIGARTHAFFLDVDGTLIDIAAHPDAVVVPEGLPDTLSALAGSADGALALVSGRTVERLDLLFAPARFAAAGSHGAQIRLFPGAAVDAAPDLDRVLAARLIALAGTFEGAFTEDKGPSLAIHYRAHPAIAPVLRRAIAEVLGPWPELAVLPGHHVFEIKRAGRDKGTAVAAFMARAPFAGRVPVFIGDDVTDEAAFRAVSAAGGVAIAVGTAREGAEAVLPDPPAVRRFLTHLAAEPRQRRR